MSHRREQFNRDMQALAKHLESQGADIVQRSDHVEVRYDGQRLATLSKNRNALRLAIGDIKRGKADLLLGYTGPGVGKPIAKANVKVFVPVKREKRGGRATIAKMETDALRFRINAVLALFDTQQKFAEWVMDVKAEEFSDAKAPSTLSGASQAVSAIKRGKSVTPIMATVINRAIDLAFELDAPAPEPEKLKAGWISEDAPIPTPPFPKVHRKIEVPKHNGAADPLKPAVAADDIQKGIRQRYIDLLLTKAEQGDEQAMERLERLSGL